MRVSKNVVSAKENSVQLEQTAKCIMAFVFSGTTPSKCSFALHGELVHGDAPKGDSHKSQSLFVVFADSIRTNNRTDVK